jgi:hypothetical protein
VAIGLILHLKQVARGVGGNEFIGQRPFVDGADYANASVGRFRKIELSVAHNA